MIYKFHSVIVEAFQTPFDISIYNEFMHRAYKGDWVVRYPRGELAVVCNATFVNEFQLISGPVNE